MSPQVGIEKTVNQDDGSISLSVFVPGKGMLGPIHSSHPFFDKAQQEAIKADPDLDALADYMQPIRALAREFKALSERVTFAHGTLFIDGDEAESDVLSEQIVKAVESGTSDYKPLVSFLEKVMSNPNEHSRKQLYNWIRAQKLELTPDGDMICYKGVKGDGNGGFTSCSSGRALVNGKVHEGYIPNAVGDVVTMPRSEVIHDPLSACHHGLHVGTFDHASSFNRDNGAMLEVHVNPRDVVSVPSSAADKCRVCRYKVARRVVRPGVEWNSVQNVPYGRTYATASASNVNVSFGAPTTPLPDHPTQAEFDNMLARAKRRRQNVEKYITKHTNWKFVGDPKDDKYKNPVVREHWVK
jgi:hypothetical protein